MGPAQEFAGQRRLLLAAAAPAEARAVWAALGTGAPLDERSWTLIPCRAPFDLVLTGVGKSSAAGAVARVASGDRHAGVMSVGVAGALPGGGLSIGDVVLGTAAALADEGVQEGAGFIDMASRGFPPGPWSGMAGSPGRELAGLLANLADRQGVIATVSTCSGTDECGAEIVRRTGAIAEAMEGAAIAATCGRIGLAFAELRVISNRTGPDPGWDLPKALARLTQVLGRLA